MDLDIRKNNKNCEYLLIDKSDKYDINKLNRIKNIDSIYLKNNESGVLTKISEQNLKQYFSSNKDQLKTIINEIIDLNRNISKEESESFLSNLFNERMNEILSTENGCCFLKFNSIVTELPDSANNGEIFGLSEDEENISYYLFLNGKYFNLIDKNYFDFTYYNRQKVNAKLEELNNKLDELINNTENAINSTISSDEYELSLNKINELQNEINLIKEFLNIRQYLNI